ncbi:Sec-independent protein translocase protein TatB [Methyloceanibacter methanicus]|uniref:Sec-independent protein translocase protein TatB n=1 Tax=Methyloceanibacter methanicus TaxID=1774968 RepID=UPI00084970FD|nr:Sec-independent protein translocase protein TatB [Methyloceanibacter methanicus]
MLDIGWSELLVVAIVAIVVVGPKDLPKLMRTIGFYAGKARRMAGEFQRQFNEAIAESEADEVRKNLEAIRANMGPAPDLNRPIGKPLMTGPAAARETDFVAPPQAETAEPPLPEPPAKAKAPKKKPTARKSAAKKAPAKTKAPAKKTPRAAKKAAANGNGEPKP